MFIREMESDGGLTVIMKGAPERILSRCTKILVNGEEKDYDINSQARVNLANDSFGKMGERVLAVAKYTLEPEIYKKDPAYIFDIKGWKEWKDVKKRDG